MTSTTKDNSPKDWSLAAGRCGKKAMRDCGMVARLGLELGDLTDLAPGYQRRVSPSLLVAEILAGAAQ
jgi:hypothetical protein